MILEVDSVLHHLLLSMVTTSALKPNGNAEKLALRHELVASILVFPVPLAFASGLPPVCSSASGAHDEITTPEQRGVRVPPRALWAFFRVCPPGFGVCVSAAAVSHLQEHHHHRGVLCPAGHPAGHHLPDGAFGPMAAPCCFKLALWLCWARGTVTVELGSPRSSALCEEQFTLAAPAALCCYSELGSLGLRFCYFCLGSGSAAVFLIN